MKNNCGIKKSLYKMQLETQGVKHKNVWFDVETQRIKRILFKSWHSFLSALYIAVTA